MKSKIIIATVVVLGIAYSGGSYYIGERAKTHVQSFIQRSAEESGGTIAWKDSQHSSGIFTSSGLAVLHYQQPGDQSVEPINIEVAYHVDHALHWAQLLTFDWSGKAKGTLGQAIDDIYGTGAALTGNGQMDWSGSAQSDINFPGADKQEYASARLTVAPLAGRFKTTENTFDLELSLPSLTVESLDHTGSFAFNDMRIQITSDDVRAGSTRMVAQLKDITLDEGDGALHMKYDGIKVDLDSQFKDAVWSFAMDQTIESLEAQGIKSTNNQFKFGIEGIRKADLIKLSETAETLDDAQDITPELITSLYEVGLSILSQGVTLRLDALTAQVTLPGSTKTESVGIKGLALSAKVPDIQTPAGSIEFTLAEMTPPTMVRTWVPAVKDLKLSLTNTMDDERLDLKFDQSLASLQGYGQNVSDVRMEVDLKGLTVEELMGVVAILEQTGGDFDNMSSQQLNNLGQIAQSALAHGVQLEIPMIKGSTNVDGLGPQSLDLQGLRLAAKVDDFDKGAGVMSLTLKKLTPPTSLVGLVPTVDDFKLDAKNALSDGRSNVTIKQSLKNLKWDDVVLGDVSIDLATGGWRTDDVVGLAAMIEHIDSPNDLSESERKTLNTLTDRLLKEGFTLTLSEAKGQFAQGKSAPSTLDLNGLDLNVKVDNLNTAAGQITLSLANLKTTGEMTQDMPQIENFNIAINNQIQDQSINYDIEKRLGQLQMEGYQASDVALHVKLDGLSVKDVTKLGEVISQLEDTPTAQQQAALLAAARGALVSGFLLDIPTMKATDSDASLNATLKLQLDGLKDAPISEFNLAKLGNLDGSIELKGQNPILQMIVPQAKAMQLLQKSPEGLTGSYQFKDGQMLINGLGLPVEPFISMANTMTIQTLAPTELPAPVLKSLLVPDFKGDIYCSINDKEFKVQVTPTKLGRYTINRRNDQTIEASDPTSDHFTGNIRLIALYPDLKPGVSAQLILATGDLITQSMKGRKIYFKYKCTESSVK